MASWIRITIMNLVGICRGKSNRNSNITNRLRTQSSMKQRNNTMEEQHIRRDITWILSMVSFTVVIIHGNGNTKVNEQTPLTFDLWGEKNIADKIQIQ